MIETKSAISKPSNSNTLVSETDLNCTLYVCLSCRTSGTPREPKENRQGYILYQKLSEAITQSPLHQKIHVKPAKCLSICPRPCGIAIASPNAWTYLFGDQKPSETVNEIIDCLSVYIRTPNGFMAREKRPKSLRSSILGRIPPMKGDT